MRRELAVFLAVLFAAMSLVYAVDALQVVPAASRTGNCSLFDFSAQHGSIYTMVIDSATNKSYQIVGLHFWENYIPSQGKYHLWVGIVINASNTMHAPTNFCSISGGSTNAVRWNVFDNYTGTRCPTWGENGQSLNITNVNQYVSGCP